MTRVRTALLIAGAAAFFSSQAAYAAPLAAQGTIDPLVSLSALATTASSAAVCAGSTAAVAAAAAVAQAGAAPGCVLPVTAPPPAPVAETAPPPPPMVETAAAPKGIGTLPLLLGLAALIGIAALLLSSGNGHGNGTPVSPA